MDVFDLSNTLKISKIALDSATILVADSPNGGDQTLPEEDDKDANANIASQQKQRQRRGNVNLWKDLGFSSPQEWHREMKGDLGLGPSIRQVEFVCRLW